MINGFISTVKFTLDKDFENTWKKRQDSSAKSSYKKKAFRWQKGMGK